MVPACALVSFWSNFLLPCQQVIFLNCMPSESVYSSYLCPRTLSHSICFSPSSVPSVMFLKICVYGVSMYVHKNILQISFQFPMKIGFRWSSSRENGILMSTLSCYTSGKFVCFFGYDSREHRQTWGAKDRRSHGCSFSNICEDSWSRMRLALYLAAYERCVVFIVSFPLRGACVPIVRGFPSFLLIDTGHYVFLYMSTLLPRYARPVSAISMNFQMSALRTEYQPWIGDLSCIRPR